MTEQRGELDMSKTTPMPLGAAGDYIQQAADRIRQEQPERYASAQELGTTTMQLNYNLVAGRDESGNAVLVEHLLSMMQNYGFEIDDLTATEQLQLQDVYGTSWRPIVEKINYDAKKILNDEKSD